MVGPLGSILPVTLSRVLYCILELGKVVYFYAPEVVSNIPYSYTEAILENGAFVVENMKVLRPFVLGGHGATPGRAVFHRIDPPPPSSSWPLGTLKSTILSHEGGSSRAKLRPKILLNPLPVVSLFLSSLSKFLPLPPPLPSVLMKTAKNEGVQGADGFRCHWMASMYNHPVTRVLHPNQTFQAIVKVIFPRLIDSDPLDLV